MAGRLLTRILGLVIVFIYVAATVAAAASPLAECPTLEPASHTGHLHHSSGSHHSEGSGSEHQPGDCLNCCMGTCLLGASLAPPSNGMSSLAFYGTPISYVTEQSVLPDRSIQPEPGPPKPIT
jgi:hypothetical protein